MARPSVHSVVNGAFPPIIPFDYFCMLILYPVRSSCSIDSFGIFRLTFVSAENRDTFPSLIHLVAFCHLTAWDRTYSTILNRRTEYGQFCFVLTLAEMSTYLLRVWLLG